MQAFTSSPGWEQDIQVQQTGWTWMEAVTNVKHNTMFRWAAPPATRLSVKKVALQVEASSGMTPWHNKGWSVNEASVMLMRMTYTDLQPTLHLCHKGITIKTAWALIYSNELKAVIHLDFIFLQTEVAPNQLLPHITHMHLVVYYDKLF